MRIAMLSWESLHSISSGGIAVHVTELAASLQRQGHEVHVFTRRAPGQDNYNLYDNVHYHLVDLSCGSDFIHEIHNLNEAMVDRFMNITNFVGKFDLIHGHDWLTAEGMVQIKERWGMRGILTMHSTEFGRNGNICHESGDPKRIAELERYGTYCANQVITVSHHLKEEIHTLYQCPEWKTHVIYNGVNYHAFDGFIDAGECKRRYHIEPLEPTILFAGRATLQKGPDILLEAIPQVLKTNPRAHFVFVADGDMLGALQWRAGELNLKHAIRFLGHIPRPEFITMMQACDIVAIPSRNEPFGIVVLEAWSAGKPVVVTNQGGPDEFVDHNGTGIKIFPTPDSVAGGLNTLLANLEHARWLGANGRKKVEAEFSWDFIGQYTNGVYEHAFNT